MQSFPGGSVVKNSLRNAGDTSSVPSPGRFHGPRGNKAHRPLTVGLLKWASEARVPGAASLQQEKPPQWEAHALELESNPHPPQLEKKPVQSSEDLAQPKINKCRNNFFKYFFFFFMRLLR